MATSSSPLSVTASLTLQAVRAAGGGGNVGNIVLPAANLVIDTFETANMQPVLNNASFRWEALLRTSIVTMNPDSTVAWGGAGFGGVINNPDPGKNWTAKEGSHSLRFRYPPNQQGGAEQRWNLTGVAQPDLWIRYWLRVPVNYPAHTLGNNKFLGLWMDSYNTSLGSKIVWELWPGANGTTYLETQMQDRLRYFGSNSVNFINYQTDRGRWMQMVYHAKPSSSIGASDAVVETWRRWEDESTFTKLSDFQNVELRMPDDPALPQGWQGSFLLGYNNQQFPEETEFLVDNFELSTGALI
jgi:hypothetical protein